MIEFLPWYSPGDPLLRCSGCGGLLAGGDTEVHTKHHDRLDKIEALAVRLGDIQIAYAKGEW